MIIYFSKINLTTTKLFELYKDETVHQDMIKSILSFMRNGVTYKIVDPYIDENDEIKEIITNYKLSLGMKNEEYISGVIYKDTRILCKKVNEQTQKIETYTVPTIEDVKFYFDVIHEIVGFHTRSRFGFQEFNQAFAEILNQCMKENKLELRFELSLYNEGMNIEEISEELRKISNIKKLIFNFKLPNPADDNMLDELRDNMSDLTEEMKDANAHSMSVIFDSNGDIGLNVGAKEIQTNISKVGTINQGISDKLAIQNGYASVKAITKTGKIFTTEEKKPIKREIYDEENFFEACRDTIRGIFINRRRDN